MPACHTIFMSNQITQQSPLWKEARTNGIQFLASWKRLAKEQPDLYKLIEQREGFQCQDAKYEYHVGVSKWGLWLSRKAISLETLKAVANNEPIDTHSLLFTHAEIKILKELAAAISELIKVRQ